MIYDISKTLLRWICRLLFCLEPRHVDKIPKTGGLLLVSNHASNLDPVLVGVFCPRRVVFLAKVELFRAPILKHWMHAVGALPIHRQKIDRKALGIAVRRVREGAMLAIFPEGTRTRDGALQPGKAGVAMIAVQAGVPCVPTYVDGSFRAWPRHHLLPRPVKVRVWYGEPFDLPERAEGMSSKDYYQLCVDEMMRRIGALRNEALAFRETRAANPSRT